MSEPDLVIEVEGLTKSFGPKTVVKNLSIQVAKGEIFGFLGPNGSGKTTFIRMLCGLLRPDSGKGVCLGYDILKDSARIKPLVGYMSQRFSLYEDLTVRENLDLWRGYTGSETEKKQWMPASSESGSEGSKRSWPEVSPADGSSAWPWEPAFFTIPNCSCWTNPLPG